MYCTKNTVSQCIVSQGDRETVSGRLMWKIVSERLHTLGSYSVISERRNQISGYGQDMGQTWAGNHYTWAIHPILYILYQSRVQCRRVEYSIVEYSTVEQSIVQYSIVQQSRVQYSREEYSTVEQSIVQQGIVEYSTVEQSIVVHPYPEFLGDGPGDQEAGPHCYPDLALPVGDEGGIVDGEDEVVGMYVAGPLGIPCSHPWHPSSHYL